MKNEAAGKTKPTRKPNKRSTKAAPQSSSELGAVSWVDALMDAVVGTRTFKGTDTGTVKLPSGGKMRLVIGEITISRSESGE